MAAVCCWVMVLKVEAQDAVTQQTSPASMNWFQINTNHFKILYPEGFDTQAQRVANTLEHVHEPGAATLGASPKKISILLHSQSSVSNGFVTLAPRRSEFYAMPPQNYNFIGTNDWFTLLSTHEYRHIVQFQKSITGFNKVIHTLFGQLATAGMAFVAAPQWFWEGDAVITETALTPSGRGRIPEFDLLFRTNFMEGRDFGYHKQYLRSYKHNVPDHYVLGYHMVSYLRKKTGNPEIWGNITRRAWGLPFIPFTFSNAIRKETGLYVRDLYNEMVVDLKKEWKSQQQKLELTPFEKLTSRRSQAYTDYAYPQPLQDGNVLVMKSGIGDIAQFVAVSPAGEEKEFVPGLINDAGMLSVAQDKVIWNEYRFDPRWQTRSYSIIKSYDLNRGKLKTIVKGSKYSAAALSPDAKRIVTVETDNSYRTRLVVIDFASGKVLKQFENKDNDLISMPRWSDDGQHIVFIRSTDNGKRITRVAYDTGIEEILYEAYFENVGHPVLYKDYLFYNSPWSGIDNIYCLQLSSGKVYQVTSASYGAYNPAVSADGGFIYYNNQSRDGLDVVRIPLAIDQWKPVDKVSVQPDLYSQMLTEQEGEPDFVQSIPDKNYASSRYRRARGMINPHSWGLYTTSNFTTLDVGISSKDVLSTTLIDVGYRYDVTEETGYWRAGVSYQGLYPIIDLEATYGNRSAKEDYVQGGTVKDIAFDWTEATLSTGLRIPLVTTQGKYLSNLSIGNSIGLTQITDFENDFDGGGRFINDSGDLFLFRSYADNGNLFFNRFNFEAVHLLKRSRRDIYSQWGQTAELTYYTTPFEGGDFEGGQFTAFGSAYFPGIFKHHSLWAYGAYQSTLINNNIENNRPTNYLFRNLAPSPRGHSVSRFQNYYMIASNYAFPIIYPDLALGPVLNIQRIRGNAFFDYAYGQSPDYNTDRQYTSFGGELTVDFNVMRFLQQFNVGVRYAYPIETKSSTFEVIIGNIGF